MTTSDLSVPGRLLSGHAAERFRAAAAESWLMADALGAIGNSDGMW